MSFFTGARAYDRFMGRYSSPLARRFLDFAALERAERVLDVGCGPGALTSELAARFGPDGVSAVDPSEQFVAAVRERQPGVDIQRASAEQLPFEDRRFDATLAQLVVHFMADPVAGLREMLRVTKPGGIVAACVWDHAGGRGPLALFWDTARELDPDVHDESQMAGVRQGHLTQLLEAAGARGVEAGSISVEVEHPSFDEWWEPFLLGVGPAGSFVKQLGPEGQARLRELCQARLPDGSFVVSASAWAARAVV